MEIIWEICLQVVEILTLIFGILGMAFSLMLLFSPKLARSLSDILNRNVSFDKKLEYLDKGFAIDEYFYNYNVLMGALIVAGSVFALFFFFFSLDSENFVRIFFSTSKNVLLGEIVLHSVSWIAKIGCFAGLIVGVLLVFAPAKMRRIENKLNSWFETKPVIDRLDRPSREFDTFFFRHTVAVGLTGAVISFFLISLSIINLLK